MTSLAEFLESGYTPGDILAQAPRAPARETEWVLGPNMFGPPPRPEREVNRKFPGPWLEGGQDRPGLPWRGVGDTLAGAYGTARAGAEAVRSGEPAEIAEAALPLAAMALPIPGASGKTKAFHGSPKDFTEFVTPAFFSRKEGIAQLYRREAGGGDNVNGIGGLAHDIDAGWYPAHEALDRAGQNKAAAMALIERELTPLPTPTPGVGDYKKRSFIDFLMARPAELTPEFKDRVWAADVTNRINAQKRPGLDYLQSGAPLGKVYEVNLPHPTAHYDYRSGFGERDAIADAIAKGHKVISWGDPHTTGTNSLIALDKNVIDILRKYAIAGPAIMGPAVAGSLADVLNPPRHHEEQ